MNSSGETFGLDFDIVITIYFLFSVIYMFALHVQRHSNDHCHYNGVQRMSASGCREPKTFPTRKLSKRTPQCEDLTKVLVA